MYLVCEAYTYPNSVDKKKRMIKISLIVSETIKSRDSNNREIVYSITKDYNKELDHMTSWMGHFFKIKYWTPTDAIITILSNIVKL